MAINVILSSANMGDVDEVDSDLWTAFVSERIDEATGLDVQVEQARFGAAGEDVIQGATEEEREEIRRFLSVDGWSAFCGEEWESRRKAHDAKA